MRLTSSHMCARMLRSFFAKDTVQCDANVSRHLNQEFDPTL